MSAFIVDERVIQRILTWMSGEIAGNPYTPMKRLLREHGIFLDEGWESRLATEMYQLNYDAVAYRYKEAEETVSLLYAPDETSLIQVLKSIHCWHYQCSEGDYNRTPLYRLLECIEGLLANKIVTSLPIYKQAEWN